MNTARAALPWALRFLARRDVVCLAVAALDTHNVAFALWLLFGDAYPLVLDERQCLHVAAAAGCWTATTMLLLRLRTETSATVPSSIPTDASPFETALAVHTSVGYAFPASVMYRAAARGELSQIQWLHAVTQYKTSEAVVCAAEARQLSTVQWLLDHTQDRNDERLQCVLRLEDSPTDVRAVGWICQSGELVHFCGVSAAHGFIKRTQTVWEPEARTPDLPLAKPFAEAGDHGALQKLLQSLGDQQGWFSRHAIVCAARGGHLGVVQWLHSLPVHTWPLATAMSEAAANGHLAVVQWLFQFPEARIPATMNCALEGGHLHIARWILAQDCPLLQVSDYLYWSAAARSMQLPVLRFVHEERGLPLAPMSALFIGLTGDQALVQYVVEKVLPPDHDCETLVFDTAKQGTLDALQYLVETKGFWSRKAFRAAIGRRHDGRALAQWIYEAAKQRSRREDTPLETVVLDFSDIHIFTVAHEASMETALWLVENVPEVSTFGFLVGVDAFHPEQLSHTRLDVLAGDATPSEVVIHASDVDALLTACVKTRPDACVAIPWLPQWAVRTNVQCIFDLLVEHGHPSLYTAETRDCVIAFSRHIYFMNALLAQEPASLYGPTVRTWATNYGLLDQLRIPGM